MKPRSNSQFSILNFQFLFLLALLLCPSARALTLAWDASAGATGYRLYSTPPSGAVQMIQTTALSAIVNAAQAGRWTFAVSAFNATGETAKSPSISYDAPSPPPPPPPPPLYALTVINGIGSGTYAKGVTVGLTANPPAAGQTFKIWTGAGSAITSAGSASTTLVMPPNSLTVTATYAAPPPPPPPPASISAAPASIQFTYRRRRGQFSPIPADQLIRITLSNDGSFKTYDSSRFYDSITCYFSFCPSGTSITLHPNATWIRAAAAGTYLAPIKISAAGCPDLIIPVSLSIVESR